MNGMEQLLTFIARLKEAKIQFALDCQREAIMVTVVTPLAYYEVEFFADGEIDVQRFMAEPLEGMTLEEITNVVIDEMTGPADRGPKD